MVDPHVHGCPEPEVLAAYVDRGLSLSERARVDAHLASCPQCIALVAGVARTVAELSALVPDAVVAAGASPLVTRRAVAGVVAAAAAVIAIVAAPSLVRPWLDRDAGLVNLVGTVGEQRSVLGRLTGGFPHAPLGAPPAGGQGGRTAGADRVQLTADRARESFGERATPAQLHALGVAHLLAGRYDDAAQSLLAASREQPANARYLNDVATAQLERARLGLRPDDLPRALAAADRARRLDPALKEAWFNRALAVSALSLTAEAKSAWTEYLKRDSVSPWAAEARSRLQDLSKPTVAEAWIAVEARLQSSIDEDSAKDAVRTQTTEARSVIEQQLLPNWAKAVLGDADSQHELERLRVMAEAMRTVAGDQIYVDAVAAIDRAAVKSGDALKRLAAAHRDYAAAVALFNNDAFAASLPGFTSSGAGFGDSSFAVLAALHQGAVAYIRGQAGEAERILTATLSDAQSKGYAYASGRSTWFLGLIAVGQSQFGDGEARYAQALDTFTRMGDVEQAGAIHYVLAALHDYLGNEVSAWRHRLSAFDALSVSRSTRLKSQVLATAVPALRQDNPETALAVQDVALAVARESGREAAITEILAQRASLLTSLGRAVEAGASARDARDHLARITDPAFRGRLEVAVLTAESELAQRFNPGASVAAVSKAIEIVEQRRDRLRLAQLNLRLARANIVWGRTAEARVALDRGIRLFNEERAASSEQRPLSALDESWQLFEASVQLSLKERDYARAFALSEAARSRSASEANRFGSVSLQNVQDSLAINEAIIALNQFDTELAVWIIKRNSVAVSMRSMSRETSTRLIERQQNEIWRQAAVPAAGRDLYNAILRPVAAHLADVERLVIVPDATFQDAAFAAFYNGQQGHYLIEDVSVRLAPSAAAFAAAVKLAGGRANISEPLIFGGSGSAAASIAAAYPASDVRIGSEATADRLFADATGRRIVHIDAKTSINRRYPLLSRLVVSDDPGARAVILGREIAQRQLPLTGLVVIDETPNVTSNRGEGTLSLARAFMAAGVPAVLGTLPGADETATRDLMIGFHREMSKRIYAEQALSTVQRNAIQQNGRRLGAWTALVLYGSDR